MAGNKKPRRCRKAKPTFTPMMKSTHDNLALELRLATETLIGAPDPVTYNQLSKMLRVLGDVGTADPALELANDTMLAICDRFERVGKVGVSDQEAEALRVAINDLDRSLKRIPVNVFIAAVAGVSVMCEEMGV